MRKVLIIGGIWPYHINASARVPPLAKYLPEWGWEPIVLTIPLPENTDLGYRVIQVPYRDMLKSLLRLLGFDTSQNIENQLRSKLGAGVSRRGFIDFIILRVKEVLDYPDLNRGWKRPAIKAGGELLQKESISAIISSSPPIMGNLIAKDLKRRHGIPWLADLPHIWSQNNGYPYSRIRRMIDRRLELKTLSRADALATTSEPLAAKLRALHKEKSVCVITHGFDPDTVNTLPDKLTDRFTITYTGSFDRVLREPTLLLGALQNLISKGVMERDDVEVRLYGWQEDWIDSDVERHDLQGTVEQHGLVPMQVALAKQRESQLLFNPKWDDPQEPGIHSMKILEYLAARRPILATGKYKDVVDDLLDETGAGTCAASIEETERALARAYQEYKSKGEVAWLGDESRIDRYSHREMARQFSQSLDELIH